MAEMKPTPAPQMRRPGTMRPMPVEATSRIHPTAKITQPSMMVRRRPRKSATSPAMMAPKNVPAERMDVTNDCLDAGMTKALTAAASLGSGYGKPVYWRMKYLKGRSIHTTDPRGLVCLTSSLRRQTSILYHSRRRCRRMQQMRR